MRTHVLLLLLLVVGSQSQPAMAGRGEGAWSSLLAKTRPHIGRLVSTASVFVLGATGAGLVTAAVLAQRGVREEIEHSYRQREIFMQALVRGEREVVSAQLELDDFALERYIGLTIHYVKNGQHHLGTVASVDRANDALRCVDSDDLVSRTEIEGVLLLDSEKPGRVVTFTIRDAHLLDPSKEHLFAGRVSTFGTVAGVTNGGYLLVRPYIRRDDDRGAGGFSTLLYLVDERHLPIVP